MPGETRILREIGLTGIPVVNCANACATGATAVREGWIAIKAGLYDLVLAVGVEKMAGDGLLGGPRESGIPTPTIDAVLPLLRGLDRSLGAAK